MNFTTSATIITATTTTATARNTVTFYVSGYYAKNCSVLFNISTASDNIFKAIQFNFSSVSLMCIKYITQLKRLDTVIN